MHRGYILKWRKQLDWEWYSDLPVRVLFDHLNLVATHKTVRVKGQEVLRGQYQISYRQLAKKSGLSLQQVRTAIAKLSRTGEILTQLSTQGMMMITILKYDHYQTPEKYSNTESNKRATQQQHKNNNVKNVKKKEEKIYGARFTPPSPEEVSSYFLENGINSGEPEHFMDHHVARGWILSNGRKMKDWRAAARTWIRNADKFKRRSREYGQKTEAAKQAELRERLAEAVIKGEFRPKVDYSGNNGKVGCSVQGSKNK